MFNQTLYGLPFWRFPSLLVVRLYKDLSRWCGRHQRIRICRDGDHHYQTECITEGQFALFARSWQTLEREGPLLRLIAEEWCGSCNGSGRREAILRASSIRLAFRLQIVCFPHATLEGVQGRRLL